jgi:hypothetical protein
MVVSPPFKVVLYIITYGLMVVQQTTKVHRLQHLCHASARSLRDVHGWRRTCWVEVVNYNRFSDGFGSWTDVFVTSLIDCVWFCYSCDQVRLLSHTFP